MPHSTKSKGTCVRAGRGGRADGRGASFIFIVMKLCLYYNHGCKHGYNACKWGYNSTTLLQKSLELYVIVSDLRTYNST